MFFYDFFISSFDFIDPFQTKLSKTMIFEKIQKNSNSDYEEPNFTTLTFPTKIS